MLRDLKKFYFFHPLLWFTIGYCIWMLIPAFFTEKGHHYVTVLADMVGYGFVVLGYFVGAALKNSLPRAAKLTIRESDETSLVLAFVLIVYGVRLLLFSEVGIYAFLHPYSRESSLLDTVFQQLMTPYIVLLMTLFWTTRKRIYIVLLLCELALFIVPTMARSYYILFPLYYFFIRHYYGRFSFAAQVKVFGPIFLAAIVFVALVGPYINAVRSYAAIGQYEKGLEFEFAFEEKKAAFLIDRLNIHGESFQIEPVIKEAAALDALAFKSMLNKWLGFSSTYEIHPTNVATEVGLLLGYGAKTSTDFPRDYILINYETGALAVVAFNFMLGLLLAVAYKSIFKANSRIFMMLWVPLVFGPAFGGQGAFPSTFVFQYTFVIFSFALLFFVFMAIKWLRRVVSGIVRTAVAGTA